jgi:SOS response regulatory protein OraA/RecX
VRRAQLMAERGYGDRYIAYRLAEIGIPEDLADQALMTLPKELSEEKRIRMVMKKEKGKKKDMVRFLAGRGFAYDSIYRVLGGEAP